MKIYVASHDVWAAAQAASVLSSAGHTITSRWHGKKFLQTSEHTVEERVAIATEDYEDVAAADALVLIAGPDRYSGGKFVETGIALGMGKHVVVIGRRENMLIWLPAIQQVDDAQGAADLLAPDFDARIRSAIERKPEPVKKGWRVFENIFRGEWGIEDLSDPDGDAILPPKRIDREHLDRIVSAYNAALSASPSPVDSRDGRDFLHRLIENAFSWALQDCNYLNPKYMDRLIDCTHDGMKPEHAAVWNATAPEQEARALAAKEQQP